VAGGLGFEPRLAESESAVLPLDDPPPACECGARAAALQAASAPRGFALLAAAELAWQGYGVQALMRPSASKSFTLLWQDA
jgi:hypothetical protein